MIRPATVEDIKPIYEMMHAYYKAANDKFGYNFQWNEDSAVIYLGNLLWRETGLNFIVNNLEGMILGEIGDTWFGPNRLAKPAALYVKPEHRNGLIARALLRRFEQEARERNAIAVLWEFEIGLTDGDLIGGLMERLGYTYRGPIYSKVFGGNHATNNGVSTVDHGGGGTVVG